MDLLGKEGNEQILFVITDTGNILFVQRYQIAVDF